MGEMKKERDRLAGESESDWVQMVLFSEWSHGYLQMPTLLREAKAVRVLCGHAIETLLIKGTACRSLKN